MKNITLQISACDQSTLRWNDPAMNRPAMNRPCDESTRDESTRDESTLRWNDPAINQPCDESTCDESTLWWIDNRWIDPRWVTLRWIEPRWIDPRWIDSRWIAPCDKSTRDVTLQSIDESTLPMTRPLWWIGLAMKRPTINRPVMSDLAMNRPCNQSTSDESTLQWIEPAMNRTCDESTHDESTHDILTLQWIV
jgi:hypothetical protein